MLLGTNAEHVDGECKTLFQSPERIHAFGNRLGIAIVFDTKFQSPERIHAFGN